MSDQPNYPQDSSSGTSPRPEPEATPSGAFPPPSAAPQHPAYPGTPPGAESNEAPPPPPAGPGSGGFPGAPPPGGFPPAPPEGGMPSAASISGQEPGAVGGRPERPKAVHLAVRLMWVGAVLAVLQVITTVTMRDSIRSAIQDAARSSSTTVTASDLDTLVTVTIAVNALLGVVIAALWVFMAWANGRGMSWARVVATVLFGLSLVFFLIGFLQAAPVLSRVMSALSLLVGAGAVFFLWQRESSAYFSAGRRA